jgi:PAS domain S-box-containing protein
MTAVNLLEQLVAASGDGMLAVDRSLRFLFVNTALEKMWGLKAADVVGQPVLELFPFLRESGEDELLARALRGEECAAHDRRYLVRATGRHGCFEARYRPLREGSEVVGALGIVRDVTAERDAEEHMRETEARFRHMADAAPVLLWMADADGLCTFFNETWLRFTGRTLDQEWGVGWAEGVHFEDFQRCMDTYLEAFNQRRVFEMEYRLRRADGEMRWVLDRGVPRYRLDGTFAGYIGSCVDITSHRAAEAELEQAVRLRDEFLSVASHELKTPLTSLQLQIEGLDRLLVRRPERVDAERLTNTVKAVGGQARRMAELVNALLDVSRITAGRLEFEASEVDLTELARQTVERFKPAASTAGSDLSLVVDGPVRGVWDRLRLEQVLGNLLSNAIKYGSGRPIEVEVRGEDGRAHVRVTDHGIGISEADQVRLFGRFERAASARNYGGLGLGLWICRKTVEAMGGHIRLASEPGQGSTFTVELPGQ